MALGYSGTITGAVRFRSMRPPVLLCLCLVAVTASAAEATPKPKPESFKGWGSSLDKHPNKPGATLKPVVKPNLAPLTPVPAAPPHGIALSKTWSAPLPLSSGGHSLDLRDLGWLLKDYGQAGDDLGPHPEVKIEGGVTYLMPQRQAEKLLGLDSHGMKTSAKVACAGFPDGLSYTSYDVKKDIYDRLYLVTDLADQVVCLQYVASNEVQRPSVPPWRFIDKDWHVYDYVNNRTKGQPRIRIDTRVLDRRSEGGFIVVNTTGEAVKQSARWYVPQPLINLILYCTAKRSGN
jgi:hypothetical protein